MARRFHIVQCAVESWLIKMTKGMLVRYKKYNVAGRIVAVQADGLVVRDPLNREYFCHESELIAISKLEGAMIK